MKLLAWLALLAFGVLMLTFALDLPPRGDTASPPSVHVSPEYLKNAEHDMETPNVVTAVLADYRGYDTLGETIEVDLDRFDLLLVVLAFLVFAFLVLGVLALGVLGLGVLVLAFLLVLLVLVGRGHSRAGGERILDVLA